MSSGLDRLAANLLEDKYKYTSGVFKNEQIALMKKKGQEGCFSLELYGYFSKV